MNIVTTDNRTPNGADFVIHPKTERYIQGIILSLICGVAFVGNFSLWIIVFRTRSLRTVTNAFLLVLSTFDLMVSLTSMPMTIVTLFSGSWLFSDNVCRGLGFLNMVTLCGSVLSLCNISINRYVMVCKPTKFYKIYTKKGAFLMIIASAIVTIGVSVPPLIGWCGYVYISDEYACFANWPLSLSYTLFMILCCFWIPFCVMIICNLKIYQQVKQSRTKIRDDHKLQISTDPQEKKATTEEIRLARVLAIVVLVFFVCWFPYCIRMILSIIVPNRVHRIFNMFTLIVGYFNSCCNPIIYGILNKRFNRGFKLLCCFWRKKMMINPVNQ